jgi:hypothetical protein
VEFELMPKYGASWHWAKLEVPGGEAELQDVRARLAQRFPVARLNELRAVYDPKNILANRAVDALLPRPQ